MFDEVGRARLVDGVANVTIPADFANYVQLDDYEVQLTAEGPAALYIADRTAQHFTVRVLVGEPDVSFVWRLSARQGDLVSVERRLPLAASGGRA
jgi:hypothetical protein